VPPGCGWRSTRPAANWRSAACSNRRPTGDLTPLFDGFFDTGVGGKKESASYLRIVERLRVSVERTMFISDVTAELDAAKSAGLQVILESARWERRPTVRR
jgi:HAD superfamily hydrolase (TIGR01509 family)